MRLIIIADESVYEHEVDPSVEVQDVIALVEAEVSQIRCDGIEWLHRLINSDWHASFTNPLIDRFRNSAHRLQQELGELRLEGHRRHDILD